MIDLPPVSPPYWALIGAAAALLAVATIYLVRRKLFPKTGPRRSIASGVTWVGAIGAMVASGQGMYEVTDRITDEWWLPWAAVCAFEVAMLAFTFHAQENIGTDRKTARTAIRLTWMLAGLSAFVSAAGAASAASAETVLPSLLIRAIIPLVAVLLWHFALSVESRALHVDEVKTTRWKWTPDALLTRLGLLTATTTDTAEAEVSARLAKVADAVIRLAPHAGGTGHRARWYTRRLTRLYRAAERDLGLGRDTDRYAQLARIVSERHAAVHLTILAGANPADLGVSPVEQDTAPVPVRVVERRRVVFHPVLVKQKPDADGTAGTGRRRKLGTAGGTGSGTGGTPPWNGTGTDDGTGGGTPPRQAAESQLRTIVTGLITAGKDVPVRPLAEQLGIPPATVVRRVAALKVELGATPDWHTELAAAIPVGANGTTRD